MSRSTNRRLVRLLLGVPVATLLGLAANRPALGAAPSNWMIAKTAIGLVNAYTGNGTLTTNAFDVPSTAEIGGRPAGWVSQPTATYQYYGPKSKTSSFLYAVDHGKVPSGTVDVIFDIESWSLTTNAEQVNPKKYLSEFVATAHAHGYKAILAPALDLTNAMVPCKNSADPSWSKYLTACSIPTVAAAAHPDVYEIQAQSYEDGTGAGTGCACYAWFVDQAAAAASAVVPGLDVRAGLSTNHSGTVSSGANLYADTQATLGSVDGYWLNVPSKGTACPSCVPGGAPQVAVSYLELLGYQP